MHLLSRLHSLWWNLAHRRRVNDALDDEVRSYVDLLAAEHEKNGMTPPMARRAALVETRGIEHVKESTRDAWVGDTLASTTREFRYALRSLRRSPAFVAIAVATLAIGIGGATAVFSVINASLLRPLPAVAVPNQLISLERALPDNALDEISYPDYLDFREQTTTLTGLAAYDGTSMGLDDRSGPTRAWVSYVSENFFTVLGVPPVLGRAFTVDDAAPGARPVVVLGYEVWQRRFGGDSSVIGATLKLNRQIATIIGVAPRRFIGAMKQHPMDLWIPLRMVAPTTLAVSDEFLESRRTGWFRVVGRLAAGKTADDARRDLAVISARLAAAYPEDKGRTVRVFAGVGMLDEERADAARLPRLLAMAVGVLLLIACANVASLSLVRATAKRRELATRLALGASRASLVRHLFIEGLVLATCATALGSVLAQALVRSASIVGTIASISEDDARPDALVLGVSVAIAALTAVLVSVFPGLQVSRTQVSLVMKDGSGGAVRRSRGQRTLVIVQVAASLVLLASAGMIFSAFQRALTANLGFDARGVISVAADVGSAVYDSTRRAAFYRGFLDRAKADPSLDGAALASVVPPAAWTTPTSVFRLGEGPLSGAPAERDLPFAFQSYTDEVSPRFFDVMRIPILLGRSFTPSDDDTHPSIAIVSRRLADAMWPNANPIGQYISWPRRTGTPRAPLEVVGVAGDTHHASLTGVASSVMYLPATHPSPNFLFLVVRGHGNVTPSAASLGRIAVSVDPTVSLRGNKSIVDVIDEMVRPQRTASAWIGVFGVIALLLAAIGLYGVVAQGVLQRTREFAVRSALGATPRGLLALVLNEGMRLTVFGAVVGVIAALLSSRLLKSLFTAIDAIDLTAALAAAIVLGVAMVAASYLPARRAARLDPATALRCD